MSENDVRTEGPPDPAGADIADAAAAAYGSEFRAGLHDRERDDIARCRVCGCTESIPCAGGCYRVPDPTMAGYLCSACAGHAVVPAGEVRRVVFGDELTVGTVLFLACRGPVCEYPAPSCRGPRGERPDHRVRLTRLRGRGSDGLGGVVVDAGGAERAWRGWADEPVTVAADTVTGQDDDGPGDAWAGIPADPRWDPYRLRVLRARWWRPWWTACVDYVEPEAWADHGDQTIVVVRSRVISAGCLGNSAATCSGNAQA